MLDFYDFAVRNAMTEFQRRKQCGCGVAIAVDAERCAFCQRLADAGEPPYRYERIEKCHTKGCVGLASAMDALCVSCRHKKEAYAKAVKTFIPNKSEVA